MEVSFLRKTGRTPGRFLPDRIRCIAMGRYWRTGQLALTRIRQASIYESSLRVQLYRPLPVSGSYGMESCRSVPTCSTYSRCLGRETGGVAFGCCQVCLLCLGERTKGRLFSRFENAGRIRYHLLYTTGKRKCDCHRSLSLFDRLLFRMPGFLAVGRHQKRCVAVCHLSGIPERFLRYRRFGWTIQERGTGVELYTQKYPKTQNISQCLFFFTQQGK